MAPTPSKGFRLLGDKSPLQGTGRTRAEPRGRNRKDGLFARGQTRPAAPALPGVGKHTQAIPINLAFRKDLKSIFQNTWNLSHNWDRSRHLLLHILETVHDKKTIAHLKKNSTKIQTRGDTLPSFSTQTGPEQRYLNRTQKNRLSGPKGNFIFFFFF